MAISVRCGCGRWLEYPDEAEGRTFGCPKCQAEITVRGSDAVEKPRSITDRLEDLEEESEELRRSLARRTRFLGAVIGLVLLVSVLGMSDLRREAKRLAEYTDRVAARVSEGAKLTDDVAAALRAIDGRIPAPNAAAVPAARLPGTARPSYSVEERGRDIARVRRWMERRRTNYRILDGVKRADGSRIYLLGDDGGEAENSLVLPANGGQPGDIDWPGHFYWEAFEGDTRVIRFAMSESAGGRWEVLESRVNGPGSLDATLMDMDRGWRFRMEVRGYRTRKLDLVERGDGEASKAVGLVGDRE